MGFVDTELCDNCDEVMDAEVEYDEDGDKVITYICPACDYTVQVLDLTDDEDDYADVKEGRI